MSAEFHVYLYGPDRGPLATSFEQAEARLLELPRLHFEPDGSFVWTLDAGQQQVFGMLYDAMNQIQYCELRGRCHHQTWKCLCIAIVGQAFADRPSAAAVILELPARKWQKVQDFESRLWSDDPF
jgi:hypothetical protein